MARILPTHEGSRDLLPLLVGIGVTFKRDKVRDCYVVRRVIENGPAGAFLSPGDIFDEVDGICVAAKAPEQLTKLVLGPTGSGVDLGIIREGTSSACLHPFFSAAPYIRHVCPLSTAFSLSKNNLVKIRQ